MSMTIEFNASATGYDETEAIACALETAARSIRQAREDYPYDEGDEDDNVMSPGGTTVSWSFETHP